MPDIYVYLTWAGQEAIPLTGFSTPKVLGQMLSTDDSL